MCSTTRRWLAAAALLLASACTIQRVYSGNEIDATLTRQLVVGQTNKGDVLGLLGPPDRILRQHDGDVFVYAYLRRNASTLQIEEPVFTDLQIFTYSKTQEKSDRVVLLFDKRGVLAGVGYRRGTEALETF